MKKTLIGALISVLLASSAAWSEDAMYFFEMGLNSPKVKSKIHYFTRALEMDAGLSAAYEKRGMQYYFQEKYSEAIEDFSKVVELNPSQSEAYRMLGLAYLEQGSHDRAIANLTRAIELNPGLASAYSHRAEAYLLKGMADEAVRDSSKAIALRGPEPIIGKAYTVRSRAYRRLGQEDLANSDFNKAYMLDPENYSYRYFTITNYLASFVSDSGYINPRGVQRVGIAAIIGLLFVLIYRLVLPAPSKEDID